MERESPECTWLSAADRRASRAPESADRNADRRVLGRGSGTSSRTNAPVGLFQPLERLFPLTQAQVDHGNVIG